MNRNTLFRYYKEFGFKCTLVVLLNRLFQKSRNNSFFSWVILHFKHEAICKYLYKHYYNVVEIEQEKKDIDNQKRYYQCIWTAWLQGEENAPEGIHLTISSIRRHAGNHQVVVISNDNVDKYIEIPLIIKEKHTEGIIGDAHYADIIRMMILAKYGGVWLDATTFLFKPIDEEAFSSQFYSVGFDSKKKIANISNLRWIVGHIGGCESSKYLSFISAMLLSYWKEHDLPIDYFVFDYLIALLYQHDNSFHDIIDHLEKRKRFTYELKLIIDEPYDKTALDNLFAHDNMYILSYRQTHQKQTPDGLETNYGYLYNQYLSK